MSSIILTSTILLNLYTIPPVEIPKFDMEEVINQLIWCESRGKTMAINKNEPHGFSWGVLQFRLDTFNHFGERYDLPHDDILNPEQQKAIARAMILDGRIGHWKVCKKYAILNFIG